jgi:hypothetical protein
MAINRIHKTLRRSNSDRWTYPTANAITDWWELDGTLIAVMLIATGGTFTASRWNVRNDGSTIFSGDDRPSLSSSVLTAEKTGLSIAVEKGKKWSLDLETISGGYVSDPLAIIMLVDDGIADIPTGGTTGQALVKSSGDDYDIEWGTVSGGGAEDLDDLSDVDTSGVSDGNVLAYDNDTSTWKPSAAGTGDVTGPASSVDNDIATFDSTTGKIIQDSGVVISTDGTFTANSDAKVPTEKAVKTYADGLKLTESIGIAVSDESTDLTTGTSKVTFRMPYAFTLTAVRANVNTAPSGSTIIVDINEGGSTILSTKLSIDASEKTSTTAASAAVISDTSLADDAEITIDIDQIGSSTPGKGLKVWLIGHRT